jgi:two-component system CheB/CheR fusion protein
MENNGYAPGRARRSPQECFAAEAEVKQLLEKSSAWDLGSLQNYKRSVLLRRLQRCVVDTDCTSLQEFVAKLEFDPAARAALADALQINVSGFFRDPEAWTHLQQYCLAPLVARVTPGDPKRDQIRAWSAGCANGEEAYSLVIAIAELLSPEMPIDSRLKVYATDSDRKALEEARKGIYGEPRMKSLSRERRERFFLEVEGSRAAVLPRLRATVVYGWQDLLSKPPIPNLDLIVCRNVLIYFDREGQSRVMDKFRFALRPGGYLFLGPAECIATEPEAFRVISAEHRIFQRED